MPNRFGGVGVTLPLNQLGSNNFTLSAGEVFYIPSGYYNIKHGPYSTIQVFDPVLGTWRPAGFDSTNYVQVDSDGNNYRLANQTGCPVAAIVSNAGSAYTSAPTVVAAAGSSTWVAVMGQVISTAITVVAGGTNYVYPPMISIQAPNVQTGTPAVAATATCTLSAGAVSTVTVVNQGAGYTTAPFISAINDPRDTTGSGAVLTSALTGAQTITAVICTNHGLPITSGTVPALTFTGGGGSSAAATIVMDWTVTSYAVTNGGAYTAAMPTALTVIGTGIPTIAPAYINPESQANFLRASPPSIVAALSSTAITATGQTLVFGGHLGSAPTGTATSNNSAILVTSSGAITTAATLTLGVGGVSDSFWMQAG